MKRKQTESAQFSTLGVEAACTQLHAYSSSSSAKTQHFKSSATQWTFELTLRRFVPFSEVRFGAEARLQRRDT
jgi:hypothetical protein